MQTAEPKVSVMVPIYNVERYLAACLEGLCRQTLQAIEIIAINDGSTDSSGEILHQWAHKDERIVIIDKPNSGYGASMNLGLDRARGEYIGIVEPDDFPELTMYARLTRLADRYECDVVKSNYFEHYAGRDTTLRNFKGFPYGRPFNPVDRPQIVCTIPSIWAGIYRRTFLERENIRFLETPGASFQDASFSLKSWFAAERCALVRRPLLHYRVDNPDSSVKTIDKIFTVCDELAESEQYLRERPSKYQNFIGWFLVDKWGKYRWNYDRIQPEVRLSFVERMGDEYVAADKSDELALNLFAEHDRDQVVYLLEKGAQAFVQAYPEGF